MVKEAVENSENKVITNKQIINYITAHYQSVNPGTINCHITICTINSPSRLNYPENQKPRICESKYDFLFKVGQGHFVRYKSADHGYWRIIMSGDNKLEIKQFLVPAKVNDDFDPLDKQDDYDNQERIANQKPQMIPKPSPDEVSKYLIKWDGLENYYSQDIALEKLFRETYPNNVDLSEVLIKVASLNEFYSTNIFSVFTVASHIINLQIDRRLRFGDQKLVTEIAKVQQTNGKIINFYSFATKYCSHHNPNNYPIFDNNVIKILKYFRDLDGLFTFSEKDLRNYPEFKDIIQNFRRVYHLEKFNFKEIDKYLWQLGKDFFPVKYK